MRHFGLLVAVVGLVGLSVVDSVISPLLGSSFLWRPSVGIWGVLCAGLLALSMVVFRVEDSQRVRIKGAAVGFVSPLLAFFIAHRGFSTVLWLYLPMLFGFGIHWLSSRTRMLEERATHRAPLPHR